MTTRTEWAANIKHLHEKLCEQQLDGALIHPSFRPLLLHRHPTAASESENWQPPSFETALNTNQFVTQPPKGHSKLIRQKISYLGRNT